MLFIIKYFILENFRYKLIITNHYKDIYLNPIISNINNHLYYKNIVKMKQILFNFY